MLNVSGCQTATRENKNTDHDRSLHIHLQPCSCFDFYRQVYIFQKYLKKPNIIIYNIIKKISHLRVASELCPCNSKRIHKMTSTNIVRSNEDY